MAQDLLQIVITMTPDGAFKVALFDEKGVAGASHWAQAEWALTAVKVALARLRAPVEEDHVTFWGA